METLDLKHCFLVKSVLTDKMLVQMFSVGKNRFQVVTFFRFTTCVHVTKKTTIRRANELFKQVVTLDL